MNRLAMLGVLLLAADAMAGRTVPESGYSNDNGVVRVSVFIDLAREKNMKFPEGTAMLRASRLLRKACPELPGKYNITGRVLTNSYNRVENIYTYTVEYDLQAIDAAVKLAAMNASEAPDKKAIAEMGAGEPYSNISNATAVVRDISPRKFAPAPTQLQDLTTADGDSKTVRPTATKKDSFRQIDANSFGGVDPMEE